jgi:hypothetical protein
MHVLRVALLLTLLLSACASEPETRPPVSDSIPGAESAAATPLGKPLPASNSKTSTIKNTPRAGKRQILALMQQSTRPINIANACSFRNETGYSGSTRIEIRDSQVRQLNTLYDIPERGSCRIEHTGFRQTVSSPSIELRHADGCIARIWTQGRQLTISYTHCESRCSHPRVFSEVWPVLIDMPTGNCD